MPGVRSAEALDAQDFVRHLTLSACTPSSLHLYVHDLFFCGENERARAGLPMLLVMCLCMVVVVVAGDLWLVLKLIERRALRILSLALLSCRRWLRTPSWWRFRRTCTTKQCTGCLSLFHLCRPGREGEVCCVSCALFGVAVLVKQDSVVFEMRVCSSLVGAGAKLDSQIPLNTSSVGRQHQCCCAPLYHQCIFSLPYVGTLCFPLSRRVLLQGMTELERSRSGSSA